MNQNSNSLMELSGKKELSGKFEVRFFSLIVFCFFVFGGFMFGIYVPFEPAPIVATMLGAHV
jgi:hypothetical protein